MAHPASRDRLLTVEEHLELERRSPTCHEYVAGQVHAMTGGSRKHNRIAGNIYTRPLGAARRGRAACTVAT